MELMSIARFVRNLLLDMQYGQFLGGIKKTPFALMGAHDTANSDYAALPYLFSDIIAEGDVLVDVGCGKGRVLNWWLTHFCNHKLFGIELDPDIASQVKGRLERYNNVSIICGDVCECLPADANLFYLFNPFDLSMMFKFRDAIISWSHKNPEDVRRKCKIIYYNPVCASVFKEDQSFVTRPIEIPSQFHKALLITLANND